MPEPRKIDITTLLGIAVALIGIVGGLILEKGSIRDIAQYTAALIVFGGTLGALCITTPLSTLKVAIAHIKVVFFEHVHQPSQAIDEIIVYATKARKHGIVSLEDEALDIRDPFLRKAMSLAVDGTDSDELKTIMELEIDLAYCHAEDAAKVFDSAGGYSPTIGIIGAVLGLIQVMKNLANIEEVGHGIAVAFVATIYGVGLANLLLLPAAGKIRARASKDRECREMALDGVLSIIEGQNPKLIRSKLEAYLSPGQPRPIVVNRPSRAA